MTSSRRSELDQERLAMARVQAAHQAYLERNRRIAEGLAAEAAEATEDGIRDIIDEDAEADTAIRAALVRQSAQRAMVAARRVAELEAQGDALAFGHITDKDGNRLAVGRRSVIDGDDVLLVDWRARASIPFYRATPLAPLGQVHRRHLHYGTDCGEPGSPAESDLVDYSDEVFDLAAALERSEAGGASELRGEAALLVTLAGPTGDRMRSVVATIQAEQDAVVRARADRALVVQGGPGTGKTVVALHRAAYLLYDQREELADSGVLVVGPSRHFLRYIADVLPSLGESGVVSVVVPDLYRGAMVRGREDDDVASLKGEAAMADLLAHAIDQRQRPPTEDFTAWYGSRSVRLELSVLGRIYARARRHFHHNDGSAAFRSLLVDRLSTDVYDPAFHDLEEARQTFEEHSEVERMVLAHFPPLTPQQALNDLLGSRSLLAQAVRKAGLEPGTVDKLFRPRVRERDLSTIQWTAADMALLDELFALLGPVTDQSDEEPLDSRDELDEFALAAQADEAGELPAERADVDGDVEVDLVLADDPYFDVGGELTEQGGEEDRATDDDQRGVVESDGTPIDELDLDSLDIGDDEEAATVVQLASEEESWRFGHVIVDEAQDLTPMQWRMVVRRSSGQAITLVGDLAQRTVDPPATSWSELLPVELKKADLTELTINYRSPVELDPLVHRVLDRIAPNLNKANGLRRAGDGPVVKTAVTLDEQVAAVESLAGDLAPGQRLGVIVADSETVTDLEAWLDSASGRDGATISVLTVTEAKGLEFDSVVVVDPGRITDGDRGWSRLYIALTRTTGNLTVLVTSPLSDDLTDVFSPSY